MSSSAARTAVTTRKRKRSDKNLAVTADSSDKKKKKRKQSHENEEKNKRKRTRGLSGKSMGDEGDEESHHHEQLLSSVTGKMERLPLYEEPALKDEEEEEEEEEGREGKGKGGERASLEGEGEEEVVETEASAGVDKSMAASYLALWDSHRKVWSFKKKTQYWLLQNMYDKKKVSKVSFKVMVRYLVDLRGNQRELARERAKRIVDQTEPEREKGSESKVKHKRARKVLRTFGEVLT